VNVRPGVIRAPDLFFVKTSRTPQTITVCAGLNRNFGNNNISDKKRRNGTIFLYGSRQSGILVSDMTGDEMIRATAEELRNFISAKAIIGDPLDLGDKVVFSIASFGFAFGAGAGTGKAEEGGGEGGGAGGGVTPIALLVIHKDVKGPEGVQIYSLTKKGQLSEIIETIDETLPSVVERVGGKVLEMKKSCAEEEEKASKETEE